MILREQEPLCRHTTLRTGGPARYFVEAVTADDPWQALQLVRRHGLPVLVLGGGYNLLADDSGFDGVVIHLATRGIEARRISADVVEVVAESGEEWDALVAFAVERTLFGLENMSLIPGTVGGAVIGNIGAYGAEVSGTLVWAEALDMRTGETKRFCAGECGLAYRRSFFKSGEGRNFLVRRAAFALKTRGALNLRYKDVADYFAARRLTAPTLADVREAVISIRQRKLPDLARVGSAGSFFKNPVLSRSEYEDLARRYPGLPGHEEADGRVKVGLAWILDKVCGLKGARQGRVGTHAQQALVVVNEGGTAAEVEAFAVAMAGKVKATTGLDLEWEVERVPSRASPPRVSS